MRIRLNTKILRKFLGGTNIHCPEAMCSDNLQPEQIIVPEQYACDPARIGMKIQPYRTEHRNIFK